MFKCLVIACLIGNPNNCQMLENIQYPVVYQTLEACKNRALEIASEVPIYLRGYRAVKWKCTRIAEGKLT